MKNLKITSLVLLLLSLMACGEDKPATPENELNFPLSFNIDHYDYDGATKYYVVGENKTYSEITVPDAYKAKLEEDLGEVDNYLNINTFGVRKIVLKSATLSDVTDADIDPDTYEVKNDTVVSYPIVIDGNKVVFTNLQTLFLGSQNQTLLLVHRVYYTSSFFSVLFSDTLEDFSKEADIAVQNLSVQDTFGIKFFNLVYAKE